MDRLSSLTSLQQQAAYELDVDIRQGELLVGGSTKKIYRSTWLNGDDSPIVLLEMKGDTDAIRQEAMLYISLDHSHIVKTYGPVKPAPSKRTHDTLLLLQEYAADGDLGNMLASRKFIPSEPVLIAIFIQIASAMIFLSHNQVIHGDLACRNVLVFQSNPENPKLNRVKLIDFGLTRNDPNSSKAAPMIPVRYAAPEILRNQGRSGYSERSDVYSFGVLVWEACSGLKEIPFAHINDDGELSRRKMNGEKLGRPSRCSDQLWNLMVQCWNDVPGSRPDFQTIFNRLQQIQLTPDSSSSRLRNSTLILSGTLYEASAPPFFLDSSRYHDRTRSRVSASDRNLSKSSRLERDTSIKAERSSAYASDKNKRPYKSTYDLHAIPKPPSGSSPKGVMPVTRSQLPCQICKHLINADRFEQHQFQCLAKDRERLKIVEQEIARKSIKGTAPCQFCGQICLLTDLTHHQNTCAANPAREIRPSPRVIPPEESHWDTKQNPEQVKTNAKKPSIFRRFFIRIGLIKER